MLMRAFYRSHLRDAVKREALLLKIKNLYAQKKTAIVIEQGASRLKGEKLTSITITEDADVNETALVYVDPNGVIAALKAIQDLTFTAKAKGLGGNSITVTYVDPGAEGALGVAVVDSAITVTLAHDGSAITSTADQIKAAIEASAAAATLVSVAVSGTGATVQTAQVETALEGGSNTGTFSVADIVAIQRIRSRKYKFVLKENANPAA